jgi:antitoxin component YwqK of YwqJK toxin-antitoxin module
MTDNRCKYIMKDGLQCSREAKKDGYCTQHAKIQYEISNDVMENILSNYIPYDELKDLEKDIQSLKVSKNRIKIKEYDKVSITCGLVHYVEKIIDGKLRNRKHYVHGVLRQEEVFDENERFDDYQRTWYPSGSLQTKIFYDHGRLDDDITKVWPDYGGK